MNIAVLNMVTIDRASKVASGKESPCNAGDAGSIPGQEDPLEDEMATHSNILAWKIPPTEEHIRLQSTGLQSQTHLSD